MSLFHLKEITSTFCYHKVRETVIAQSRENASRYYSGDMQEITVTQLARMGMHFKLNLPFI